MIPVLAKELILDKNLEIIEGIIFPVPRGSVLKRTTGI